VSGRLDKIAFAKHDVEFWAGVSRIAARARARGDLGQDGNPIWSINEWKAFCRGCRAYTHLPMMNLQAAVANTVHEVEAMIADGFSAGEIHGILAYAGTEAQIKANAQRESSRRDPVYYQPEYLIDPEQT